MHTPRQMKHFRPAEEVNVAFLCYINLRKCYAIPRHVRQCFYYVMLCNSNVLLRYVMPFYVMVILQYVTSLHYDVFNN